MSSPPARTGRQHQRYDEDNFRLVAGCIPYKVVQKKDEDSSRECPKQVEVLMVSSPKRNDLVFPKGGWEEDETVEEAARREALEEAGVKGILKKTPLGKWEFRSKSRQEMCCSEGGCRGLMFAMEVTEELEDWPEQANRSRKWLSIEEASKLCRYKWMHDALENFSTSMARGDLEGDEMMIMMKERIIAVEDQEHPSSSSVSKDLQM